MSRTPTARSATDGRAATNSQLQVWLTVRPMPSLAKNTTSTIIPCLRYRDAPAAIEWLCKVFGFEKNLVCPGEGGTIMHAQLTFGNGMIMLGSLNDTRMGPLRQAAR